MTDVYLNKTRGLYSLRERGYVVDRAEYVEMAHVRFVVSEAGRQWTLRKGKKCVHAVLRGEIEVADIALGKRRDAWQMALSGAIRVTYNPFKGPYFASCATGEAVDSADFVIMQFSPAGKPEIWAMGVTFRKDLEEITF